MQDLLAICTASTGTHDVLLFESNTDIEAMRSQHPTSWNNEVNIVAKTLPEVFLPVVSTPRKFGTTRMWTLKVPLHPDTDAPFEEHVIAVREEPNLHLEFYQPDVPMECADCGNVLSMCQRVFRRRSKFHRASRTQCSPLLSFSGSTAGS